MAASELSNDKPGIVSAFRALILLFLIVIITWSAICLYRSGNTYDTERVKKRYENLKKLNADNAKKLTEYAWVDKAKGTVQLPIDQAMQITVRELSAKKPMPGNPIATPVPAAPVVSVPTAGTAPSPTPAAAATPTVSLTP